MPDVPSKGGWKSDRGELLLGGGGKGNLLERQEEVRGGGIYNACLSIWDCPGGHSLSKPLSSVF